MKKHNLFKILMMCFFAYVILTWLIPTGSYSNGELQLGSVTPLGLFDLFRSPLTVIANFVHYGMIVLAIGGLYGVMNKTGVYGKMVDSVVKAFKGKEVVFLSVVVAVISLLTSVFGLNFLMFSLMPLVVSILMEMNFSKLNSLLAAVGPIFIGTMASTFNLEVSGYQQYFLGIKLGTNVIISFIFLAVLVAALVFYILKTQKVPAKKSVKSETRKAKKEVKAVVEEVKENIPLLTKGNKKKSVLPLAIIFALGFVVLLVGMFNWGYIFNVDVFNKLHTSISDVDINGFAIISNFIGSTSALGLWDTYSLVIILVMESVLLGWLYNLKLDEIIDGFLDGLKAMVKPAFYVILASVVMMAVLTASSNIVVPITHWIMKLGNGFNVFTSMLSAVVSSLFFNDYTQALYVASPVMQATMAQNMLPVSAFIYQVIQGISFFVLPTSALLVGGLVYLDIPFKEWIKHIWKFALYILGIGIAVIIIVGIFA